MKNRGQLNRGDKIVILGSGALSIGQAGEFDYSGSQAARALEEEGFKVIIINPNIATVQTNPTRLNSIYLYPLTPFWVEKVFEAENPVAILAGFGGQIALNCLLELEELKILEKHDVQNLGTSTETLRVTEDRFLFSERMKEIQMPVIQSFEANSPSQALEASVKIGFPLMIRSAYTLGGLGSAVVNTEDELIKTSTNALSNSNQVLIEKSLAGWKEIEYEVMRDSANNCITICNMENLNPVGIHTGDSFVVAPSQTLDNESYQILRSASIRIVRNLGVIGECNVQFAVSPNSKEFYVIEVNARLSRSSALASKAAGYPIAYLAAKVTIGKKLDALRNPIAPTTSAFFEPSFDYLTIKIPKWNFDKFQDVDRRIGTAMKSVGEIMAIGRSFQEAFQKGIRSISNIETEIFDSKYDALSPSEILTLLKEPNDHFFQIVVSALSKEIDIEKINKITKVNKWFLQQLESLVHINNEIKSIDLTVNLENYFSTLTPAQIKKWKCAGFSDNQIVTSLHSNRITHDKVQDLTSKFRNYRKSLGITPKMKKIDSSAGEHPTDSNYMYMTYEANFDDNIKEDEKEKVIIIGSGPYQIGASVEFDWCVMGAVETARELQYETIVINCNPETVSTDFNSSDKLYFEEISLERVLDISEKENATAVIICMGGQISNNLAKSLEENNMKILGHSATTINVSEDRSLFSSVLDQLDIDQPNWTIATSEIEISNFIKNYGFPVLIRPSFVLSGAAMNVAYDLNSLTEYLKKAKVMATENSIVISEFLENSMEIEVDGVSQHGKVKALFISEHIENAGTHSGDANIVHPPQKLSQLQKKEIKDICKRISLKIMLNGPFNLQLLLKKNKFRVIELNCRASRTFPFVSKVTSINLSKISTRVILGESIDEPRIEFLSENTVGVKSPLFSFARLPGADPILSVEMSSTGEAGCIAEDLNSALRLSFESTGISRPTKGIILSINEKEKPFKKTNLLEKLNTLNIPIYSTNKIFDLDKNGNELNLNYIDEQTCQKMLISNQIDLLISIPEKTGLQKDSINIENRILSVSHGIPVITNIKTAAAFSKTLDLKSLLTSNKVQKLAPFKKFNCITMANK